MNYMNNDPSNGIHYFGASPLANAPRRVFGSFSADGSPVPQHAIPGGIFTDDLSGYGMDDGDHGDPKRRRIARVGGRIIAPGDIEVYADAET
jgi:hypothetical protein